MRHRLKSISLVVAVLALAAGCSDTPSSAPQPSIATSNGPLPLHGRTVPSGSPVQRDERDAALALGRAMARALSDSEARQFVKAALARSAVKEHKLHFASFLAGRGLPLLKQLQTHARVSASDLRGMVESVRDLEFYMPVKAHQKEWTGAEPVLVAVALSEEEAPIAFTASGQMLALDRVHPPVQPVLVLVPVETNFSSQIAANALGRAESICSPLEAETLVNAASRCATLAPNKTDGVSMAQVPAEVTGLYVERIEFFGDECGGECWAAGDPEYQIITFGRNSAGDMTQIACSGDAASGERHYDQNGRTWAGKALLLTPTQMNTAIANDSGWVHQFWEDDVDGCTLRPSVDPLRAAISAGVDAYILRLSTNNPIYALAAVSGLIYSISNLVVGGDDYIGTAVEKSVTGYTLPAYANIVIMNDGSPRGRATIKPYTASGIYVGPVAEVRLSQPYAQSFPIGTGLQLLAYGFDSFGTPVANRPVTWSSSNPSVATVGADGFVSGVSEGDATITATIDGVQGSTTVYPKAIGAPVEVRVSVDPVILQSGGSIPMTAALYDANGFQVPVVDSYTWSSSNPTSCDIIDGVVYAYQAFGSWITVTSSQGFTDTVYCSVDGGNQDNRMPRVQPLGAKRPVSTNVGTARQKQKSLP